MIPIDFRAKCIGFESSTVPGSEIRALGAYIKIVSGGVGLLPTGWVCSSIAYLISGQRITA